MLRVSALTSIAVVTQAFGGNNKDSVRTLLSNAQCPLEGSCLAPGQPARVEDKARTALVAAVFAKRKAELESRVVRPGRRLLQYGVDPPRSCINDWECYTGETCIMNYCSTNTQPAKYPDEHWCNNNDECQSGNCKSSWCKPAKYPDEHWCNNNADCQSDYCKSGWCKPAKYPDDHWCNNNADCQSDNCRSGWCRADPMAGFDGPYVDYVTDTYTDKTVEYVYSAEDCAYECRAFSGCVLFEYASAGGRCKLKRSIGNAMFQAGWNTYLIATSVPYQVTSNMAAPPQASTMPAPGCSEMMCMMYCEYGNKMDKYGCPMCACNEAPLQPCCRGMTAQCLSCEAGVSEAAYCAANPATVGCPQASTMPAPTTSAVPMSSSSCNPNSGQVCGCVYNTGCFPFTSQCVAIEQGASLCPAPGPCDLDVWGSNYEYNQWICPAF